MTALSATKRTQRLGEHMGDSPHALPIKAGVVIHKGAIVVNDAGVAAPGRTAAGLLPMGIASQTYDNTGGAAGAMIVECEAGDFRVENSTAGDLIAASDIGSDCYLVDDQTAAKTSNSSARSRLGKVVKVDSEGLFVRIGAGF